MRFHFRFLYPNRSLLELDVVDAVCDRIQKDFSSYTAGIWEVLARQSVPFIDTGGYQ